VNNLAEVTAGAEPMMEPVREQPALLDGEIAVVLLAAMERVGRDPDRRPTPRAGSHGPPRG
jgi:hypothetical protein